MFTNVLSARPPTQFHVPPYQHHPDVTYDVAVNGAQAKLGQSISPKGIAHGGFQGRLVQPRQYVARPMQRPSALLKQTTFTNFQPHGDRSGEHMLRRKTPNGTLAAGYDGDLADLDAGPHAIKHFLVPPSEDNGSTTSQMDPSQECAKKARPSPHDQPHNALERSEQRQSRYMDYQNTNQPAEPTFVNGGLAYPHQGVDSVLNQGGLVPHVPQYWTGQHVPTILQPIWPPCVGLTSMNTTGPYGPYWPDGAYVPYRPAPLKDPRFCHQPQMDNIPSVGNTVHYATWLGSHEPNHQERHDKFAVSPIYRERLFAEETELMDQRRHNELNTAPKQQWHGRLHHHDLARVDIDCENKGQWAVSDLHHALDATAPELTRQGSHAQFKEKVLTWAHKIYVSLLATIHHSRRNEPLGQYSEERQIAANLYPRPPNKAPLQPWVKTTQVSAIKPMTQKSSNELAHSNSITQPGFQTQTHTDHPSNNALDDNEQLRQSQGFWRKNISHPVQARKHYSVFTQPSRFQPSRTSNTSASNHNVEIQQDQTHVRAALNAMEMLSRLCSESDWQWTEGMLLGGCLAYGLGDLSRALKWYCKVLNCDSNNVEAVSNLAATLLALGRRDEAEQQWRRSIKLRPSYFEAVEHLIGLLCEDRRGKEAVKIIEFVQNALRIWSSEDLVRSSNYNAESGSEGSLSPDPGFCELSDYETSDLETYGNRHAKLTSPARMPAISSGYAIPASENGRMLALVHGKGNMLYALGDNVGAAKAFEDAILIGSGRRHLGIHGLIKKIQKVFAVKDELVGLRIQSICAADEPILLMPEVALETSKLVFPPQGQLPGLADIANGVPKKAAVSIISNSLLSLAKIYQDGLSSSGATVTGPRATSGVQDILALYYLSLSLQPSPSTANNVGILLASVQQSSQTQSNIRLGKADPPLVPGVVPGSGVALALAYYNYGLNLDSRHAHLYTNLGSLFKDIGQLDAAIKMYEKAVECDGKFDIALANLANAVKDRGRISDAILYYQKAVSSNPDFAEAVCGLANALNSVCSWAGRGGVKFSSDSKDRWHVDGGGMLYDARQSLTGNVGWIGRVVAIVEKQLKEGESWGKGILHTINKDRPLQQLRISQESYHMEEHDKNLLTEALHTWVDRPWEGARVVRLVERATKRLGWCFYQKKHVQGDQCLMSDFIRPQLPPGLAIPSAPTVLPFHTFTCPLRAKQIRQISQRNGLRISCSTLRAPWLPAHIFEPPKPPCPQLNIGYVSSDFNNHPLAHLMQSVFGFHDQFRFQAFCYATTASDGSIHRQQIEREAPVFVDASSWSVDRLVKQVVADGIHILINLNGYTRGARNEVFAARPAPIQMSFMGFAGTLGAEWCDYLLADKIAIPPSTLRASRCNISLIDQTRDGNNETDGEEWVYGENIIFTRDTFFCCDHRQSAPDAQEAQLDWHDEQKRRWKMRKELFPSLHDDAIILGNFNQLYKIEPTTFRTWLRILSRLPKAILWLLRFPDLGEANLRRLAVDWVGEAVADRIVFTDVAPKSQHIARARVCDLFLDTPECNAHTTAADVLWSGTPLLTLPRYEYKMCSRMAASILTGALPKNAEGDRAAKELIARNDDDYEERAVDLASGLVYPLRPNVQGFGKGRLVELRRLLYESRRTSALFDTRRWVKDLEAAYGEAWRRWVAGIGGDIWL